MRYQAVLFDLFGTLVPVFPEEEFRRSLNDMAEALGVDPGSFHRAWVFETWHDRATGVFDTVEANLKAICTAVNVTASDAQMARAIDRRLTFTRSILQPRSDALFILEKLRSRGMCLGLVSDCSAEVPAMWPELPFAPYFDRVVFSCVLRTKKPDPRMYKGVYEALEIPAQRCLYVGDGFGRELSGAAGLGMRPILIWDGPETRGNDSSSEAAAWTGDRIRSLTELLAIIG
jgi:putative hydrolase of the HAD superfamily